MRRARSAFGDPFFKGFDELFLSERRGRPLLTIRPNAGIKCPLDQWFGFDVLQQLLRCSASVLLMSNRLVHSWAPFIGTPGADSQAIDAGARAQNGSPGWKWGFVVPGIPVTGSFATPWQDVQCS